MASRRAELGNGRATLRQDHGQITAVRPEVGTIMFKNNCLVEVLRGKSRRHDGLNKIIALGKINPKSAAQAEEKFLEYFGHGNLLMHIVALEAYYVIEI